MLEISLSTEEEKKTAEIEKNFYRGLRKEEQNFCASPEHFLCSLSKPIVEEKRKKIL